MRNDSKQTGLKFLLPVMLLTLLASASVFSMAEDSKATEYRIKAAFLYNFSRFVTWPEAGGEDTGKVSLCTLGGDPFGKLLDALAGKSVHKSSLHIKRLDDPGQARECQIVFISRSASRDLEYIISLLRDQPTLTVSDMDGFTAHGGIIQFKRVNNRVQFDINIDAANLAGLTISSKLLSLATVVRNTQ